MPLDCFKILKIPRRPWLEESEVQERFHQLAANLHPDVAAGSTGEFADLNQAWQTLRSPASRLRHFLELEHPDLLPPTEFTIPKDPELFMRVSELQHAARTLSTELTESKSPLNRALLEPRRLQLLQIIKSLGAEVADQIAAVHRLIQSSEPTPESLTSALNELIFLEKWSGQLRESRLAVG